MVEAVALTKKQEAFAVECAQGAVASDAYRAAYGAKRMSAKTINEAASRLRRNSKVAARIEELCAPALAKSALSVERTLQEVARVAYFDPRKLYREDGQLKRPDEWDDDTAAAVGSIEVLEEFTGKGAERELSGYTKKLKIWDKNAALDKAMKHLGLYEKDNSQRGESLEIKIELV